MKLRKILLLLSAVGVVWTQTANAKIWNVDNNAGSKIKDFTLIQAAHDGAAAGDTLYILGSPTSYGALMMTKKLIIMGCGYFLDENLELQIIKYSSSVDEITINTGAQGTFISSCSVSRFDINTSNIIIRRCYIHYDITTSGAYTSAIDLAASISNITIAQNYIYVHDTYSISGYCIKIADNCSNVVISNNSCLYYYYHSYSIFSGNTVLWIVNNVLLGKLQANNSEFSNNIQRDNDTFAGSNNSLSHNISSSTTFGTVNGNKSNINMTSVFVTSGTSDSRWKLADASPAKGAGLNGADIGMFGGSDPYVLSGIPPIPTIYQLDVPLSGSSTGGLKISVKAKTNK